MKPRVRDYYFVGGTLSLFLGIVAFGGEGHGQLGYFWLGWAWCWLARELEEKKHGTPETAQPGNED